MHTIYKVTGPTGRVYIGATAMTLKDRWRHHLRAARANHRWHDFRSDIIKFGPEAFLIEVLELVAGRDEAMRREAHYIAQYPDGYNISPGGEFDLQTAIARHKFLMENDEEWLAFYKAALSEGIRTSEAHKARRPILHAQAAQWRKDNPKQAWKQSYRASRVACRAAGHTRIPPAPPTGRIETEAYKKYRKAEISRRNALAQHAARTPEEEAAVGAKIGQSLRAFVAELPPEEKQARDDQLASARSAIDKKKQGAAASRGLKKYWEDLRKDPVRYEAYIAARRATLLKTLEAKNAA